MAGGGMYETGAGGSGPSTCSNWWKKTTCAGTRWANSWRFAVSLEDLGIKTGNKRPRLLAKTLDAATGKLLDNGKSPSPEDRRTRQPRQPVLRPVTHMEKTGRRWRRLFSTGARASSSARSSPCQKPSGLGCASHRAGRSVGEVTPFAQDGAAHAGEQQLSTSRSSHMAHLGRKDGGARVPA